MIVPDVLRGVISKQSDLSDPPPKPIGVPDGPAIELQTVRDTYQSSVAAREAFVDAVWAARDAGHSNMRIASYARMTEAGIRMLLKRTRSRRQR